MVKLWFHLFILVIVGQNILGIIIKDGTSKKLNSLHNLRHSITNKKHGHHKNFVKTRLEAKRCTIFCPTIIIFPHSNTSSGSSKSTKNGSISHTTAVKLTTKPASTIGSSKKPLNQSGKSFKKIKKEKVEKSHHSDVHKKHNRDKEKSHHNSNVHKKHDRDKLSHKKHKSKLSRNKHKTKNHRNHKKFTKKSEKKHFPRERRNVVTTKATKSRKKIIAKKYSYHDLNPNQKLLVLKKLNLGNRYGKKAYEFRETSTSQCRVVCLEEYVKVEATTVSQKVSTTESEDSDEDSFEEGEDTPIEATIKPAKPQSIVIGGIRPFGHVNFNGFDDFGPNGDPAKDIPIPGEHKKKQIDKGRKHPRKHKTK